MTLHEWTLVPMMRKKTGGGGITELSQKIQNTMMMG